MDKAEARTLLTRELAAYRARSFADLMGMVRDVTALQIRGPSGAEYTVEIEVRWDDPRARESLRVLGAIDDGRLPGAISPLCESFIVDTRPSGTKSR